MYSECDSLILFFNDTATTEIYTYGHTLSLHDALPIYNVARLNDADDIFDGPFSDRQSGMGAFEQAGTNGVCICVCVNPVDFGARRHDFARRRSEEHTSELQSLMRISYAVFCLKKKHIQYYTFISPL